MYLIHSNSMKFTFVVLMLCLSTGIASAQLEFSNWFVENNNTILHIEPDGTTSIRINNDIFSNDDYSLCHILSDKDGVPVAKIGIKKYKYDNGVEYSSAFTINYIDGTPIFTNEKGHIYGSPFMIKSPDNQYVYILHNTFSYEVKNMINICKTEIRCFCKNNLDKSDKGKDFVVHEFTHTQPFNFKGNNQDSRGESPFFCALSHTDGKSVWVLAKTGNEDSLVATKIIGDQIIDKVYSYLHLDDNEMLYSPSMPIDYNIIDNGKIFYQLPKSDKTLGLFFDQDRGLLIKKEYYDFKYTNFRSDVTATGKYMYYSKIINIQKRQYALFRIKIDDLEKNLYDKEERVIPDDISENNLSPGLIRIGIDGNLYVQSSYGGDNKVLVVLNSESDDPQYITTQLPRHTIPNYLYSYELFSCTTDCYRNATFFYPKDKDQIFSYNWDFGDGETSTEISPTHKYSKAGIYNVKLVVTLKNGYKKKIPTRAINILEHNLSASFDNAQVCNGEPLNLLLQGDAPFNVFFTLNGETKTISTTDSKFIMNNISGRYKITKVSDKYCETIPTDNIEAEILPALKPLQIVVD